MRRSSQRRGQKKHLKRNDYFDVSKSTNMHPRKKIVRMDQAFSSGKYFKRKGIQQSAPYGSRSNQSVQGSSMMVRNSADVHSFKQGSKRTFLHHTGDSTRETRAVSELKSSGNNPNASSEYSFNDRGFKEYDRKTLMRKKRSRPMTADIRTRASGKSYILILI